MTTPETIILLFMTPVSALLIGGFVFWLNRSTGTAGQPIAHRHSQERG